jgi:hypothetical protein
MVHDPASPASPMSSSSQTSIDEEHVVAAFDTVMEAELARGRLEIEGIAARIVDGNVVGIAQHLSMAVGGAKVVVHERDLAAARAVLFSPSALVDDDAPAAPEPDALAPLDADALALRALRASVVGLVILPPFLHLYSLWLLRRVRVAELSAVGRRRRAITLAIDGTVLIGSFALGALLFR